MFTYYINVVCTYVCAAAITLPEDWLKRLGIAVVIGLIIGLIYASILKGQLKSVIKNDSAADYKRPGSFKLEESRDTFLYSKTEKKEKPKNNEQK